MTSLRGRYAGIGRCRAWTDPPGGDAKRPPNIIVILCDDLHYSDVGCYGSTEIPTPNIDRLAADGMKLTSFYVAPICTPTRAMAMTGCYPIRVGIPGNVYGGTGLQAGTLTLPGLLKTRGYATACIGKWKLFEPGARGLKKRAHEAGALFDLDADLGETRNVASDHPEVVQELTALLADGRARLGNGLQIGSDVRVADPGYQRYKERLEKRRGR